jgi:hypothetical protein
MMNSRLSAAFAVILPVSLGLGLVYLVTVGRIGMGAALASALALAGLIGAVVFLRDFAAGETLRNERHPRY